MEGGSNPFSPGGKEGEVEAEGRGEEKGEKHFHNSNKDKINFFF